MEKEERSILSSLDNNVLQDKDRPGHRPESHLPMFHRGHSAGKALWLLVRHGAKEEGALQPRDVEYFLTARILGNFSSRLDALAKEASFWALCFSCNTKPLDYGASATEGVFRNNQGLG